MDFKISIALHIIGIVMWVGGLMILTRFLKIYTGDRSGSSDTLSALIKRVYFGYAVPGCVIALGTGLYQILHRGFPFYMSQGWFHGKLTLIVILLVVTLLAYSDIKKAKSGVALSKGRVAALHGVIGLVLLGAVFLTVLGSPLIQ